MFRASILSKCVEKFFYDMLSKDHELAKKENTTKYFDSLTNELIAFVCTMIRHVIHEKRITTDCVIKFEDSKNIDDECFEMLNFDLKKFSSRTLKVRYRILRTLFRRVKSIFEKCTIWSDRKYSKTCHDLCWTDKSHCCKEKKNSTIECIQKREFCRFVDR